MSCQRPAAFQAYQSVGTVKGQYSAAFWPGLSKVQLIREGVKLIAQKIRRRAHNSVIGGTGTQSGQIPIFRRRVYGPLLCQLAITALAENVLDHLRHCPLRSRVSAGSQHQPSPHIQTHRFQQHERPVQRIAPKHVVEEAAEHLRQALSVSDGKRTHRAGLERVQPRRAMLLFRVQHRFQRQHTRLPGTGQLALHPGQARVIADVQRFAAYIQRVIGFAHGVIGLVQGGKLHCQSPPLLEQPGETGQVERIILL